MNNKISKKLRKIISPTDEISRRNYQRAKEKYKSLSSEAKPLFIEELEKIFLSHWRFVQFKKRTSINVRSN